LQRTLKNTTATVGLTDHALGSHMHGGMLKRHCCIYLYLARSEKPVEGSLNPEEPGDDAPPVARQAERDVVVAGGSNTERHVHESRVAQPEQRHAHLVGHLRPWTPDAIARVPVSSPFLRQSRVVCVVLHAVTRAVTLYLAYHQHKDDRQRRRLTRLHWPIWQVNRLLGH